MVTVVRAELSFRQECLRSLKDRIGGVPTVIDQCPCEVLAGADSFRLPPPQPLGPFFALLCLSLNPGKLNSMDYITQDSLSLGFWLELANGRHQQGSLGGRTERSRYLPAPWPSSLPPHGSSRDNVSLRLQLLGCGPSSPPQLSLSPSYTACYPRFFRARIDKGFQQLLLPGCFTNPYLLL